jgi:hypothetical protein
MNRYIRRLFGIFLIVQSVIGDLPHKAQREVPMTDNLELNQRK